eukprot:g29532.t1
MSSLKAARADNFYYPPNWDPSQGNVEQWQGLAPGHLGKRAKDQASGVLIIRFELPFNCWCLHCKSHIGKGVRYNAEKRRVGKYFSTTIYEFTMFCHLCNGEIKIQTDPENNTYKLTAGLRKKHEEYSAKDAEAHELMGKEEKERMEKDSMFKLENVTETAAKAKAQAPQLEQLYDLNEVHYDELASNSLLRKKLRARKAEDQLNERQGAEKGLSFALLPQLDKDRHMAEAVLFAPKIDAERSAKLARLRVSSGSIFSNGDPAAKGAGQVGGNRNHQQAVAALRKSLTAGLTAKLRLHSGGPSQQQLRDMSAQAHHPRDHRQAASSSAGDPPSGGADTQPASPTPPSLSSAVVLGQGAGLNQTSASSATGPPLMVVRKKNSKHHRQHGAKEKKAKKKKRKTSDAQESDQPSYTQSEQQQLSDC